MNNTKVQRPRASGRATQRPTPGVIRRMIRESPPVSPESQASMDSEQKQAVPGMIPPPPPFPPAPLQDSIVTDKNNDEASDVIMDDGANETKKNEPVGSCSFLEADGDCSEENESGSNSTEAKGLRVPGRATQRPTPGVIRRMIRESPSVSPESQASIDG